MKSCLWFWGGARALESSTEKGRVFLDDEKWHTVSNTTNTCIRSMQQRSISYMYEFWSVSSVTRMRHRIW